MKTVITELFDCIFELPDDFFEREPIKKNIERQEIIIKELSLVLPEKKKKLLYEYEVVLHDAMQEEVVEAFKQGVRIGFKLKKEVWE